MQPQCLLMSQDAEGVMLGPSFLHSLLLLWLAINQEFLGRAWSTSGTEMFTC